MARRKIIAIIESDFLLRRYLERLLAAAGYATDSFATAAEFLADAAACNAACLVLDVELSDSSGRELVGHPTVRALQCPIVLVGGTPSEGAGRPEVSVVEYVRKPIKAIDFLAKVAAVMRTR